MTNLVKGRPKVREVWLEVAGGKDDHHLVGEVVEGLRHIVNQIGKVRFVEEVAFNAVMESGVHLGIVGRACGIVVSGLGLGLGLGSGSGLGLGSGLVRSQVRVQCSVVCSAQ